MTLTDQSHALIPWIQTICLRSQANKTIQHQELHPCNYTISHIKQNICLVRVALDMLSDIQTKDSKDRIGSFPLLCLYIRSFFFSFLLILNRREAFKNTLFVYMSFSWVYCPSINPNVFKLIQTFPYFLFIVIILQVNLNSVLSKYLFKSFVKVKLEYKE